MSLMTDSLSGADRPVDPQTRRLVLDLIRAGDTKGANAILDELHAQGLSPKQIAVFRASAALVDGDLTTTAALLQSVGRESGETKLWERLFKEYRQQKAARKAAERESRGAGPALSRATRVAPDALESLGAGLHLTEAGDVMVDRRPDSRSALIVFKGMRTLGGGVLQTSEWLDPYPVNIIYACDLKSVGALDGISSLADSYPGAIERLQALARAWSVERWYALGYSAGGYPAVRYGLDLDARRVMTFSGPTIMTGKPVAVDSRLRGLVEAVMVVAPHMCVDLREVMQARTRLPEVIAYYGEEMPRDARHARNLDGLPGVSLRPLPGPQTHDSARLLKEAGGFRAAIDELLADRL